MGENFGLAFHNIWAKLVCDVSGDGICDTEDIDAIMNSIGMDAPDAKFDLNGDGSVTHADRDLWLSEAANVNGFASPYLVGDANLDGSVNSTDLGRLGTNWQQVNVTWGGGDFNGDGVGDFKDLNAIALNWSRSIPDAAVVPEPSRFPVFLLAVLFHRWRRSELLQCA